MVRVLEPACPACKLLSSICFPALVATGMIVGPNESLKEIFPEGSDSAAWKKAMEHTRLKNDVGDIEARSVPLRVNRALSA